MPGFHHVEVWVAERGLDDWGWLLAAVGFERSGSWSEGETWFAPGGGAYLTLTTSPNLSSRGHDRRRPGLNHLAFRAGTTREVDRVMAAAPAHGWTPLYHDRYPHAGGRDHYAGWLENAAGFKVELVAD